MLHDAGWADLDGRVARGGGDMDGAIEGVPCGEGASLGSGCQPASWEDGGEWTMSRTRVETNLFCHGIASSAAVCLQMGAEVSSGG